MKLLQVIGSMDPRMGGVCQSIRNFAPGFAEMGNTVEVLCLDDPGSSHLDGDPFRVHALGQGRGGWNYHPALSPWLKKHLMDYDAVILNGLWQSQGYALWRATQGQASPPYYIFPHGMLDPWFQKISVRPWKALRNWIFWKMVEHRVVHGAAALLFTCEEERRLARVPFRPYAPQQEVVVGLGLPEPPGYQPRMTTAFAEKCPSLAGKKYFLFIGRIHPKKGVDLLINAYAALCRAARGRDLPCLVVAGPGLESQFGKKMQKLAAETCPPMAVCWPGMLMGDAKWGALYNCEASILPSHQENYGIAVVETLACGRPVLISNRVNIWREIKEAGAGLVQSDSVHGVTHLLEEWINSTAEAKSTMTAQAKPCYHRYFSLENATRKLVSIIA